MASNGFYFRLFSQMKWTYLNPMTRGQLVLYDNEHPQVSAEHYTMVWNLGESRTVIIDEVPFIFPGNAWLPLMSVQQFRFTEKEGLLSWQFNREFYCIIDHDDEVNCAGFLFYGSSPVMLVLPEWSEIEKLHLLAQVFKEEFNCIDTIQGRMLQMLLARLIIKLTRLAKKQYGGKVLDENKKYDLIRQFNILVEKHFRQEHQVAFYARQLHKSPKTIANLFSQYHKPASKIIRDRVVLEAKRLLYYSNKSVKEIAYELGFEDLSHFSHFITKHTGQLPSAHRKKGEKSLGRRA